MCNGAAATCLHEVRAEVDVAVDVNACGAGPAMKPLSHLEAQPRSNMNMNQEAQAASCSQWPVDHIAAGLLQAASTHAGHL